MIYKSADFFQLLLVQLVRGQGRLGSKSFRFNCLGP